MPHQGDRIALLIDAENAPASKIATIMAELDRRGNLNIRRAYGDWTNGHLKTWEDTLLENAIQPMQQFTYTPKKNATDIALTIDAIDLFHTKRLDGFALVSSDADFTPLVVWLRAAGAKVLGFGEQKAPLSYQQACSEFFSLDQPATSNGSINAKAKASAATKSPPAAAPPKPTPTPTPTPTAKKDLSGDTRNLQLLRSAVKDAEDAQGWAHLGAVGHHMAQQGTFDLKSYGYSQLNKLIAATPLFDVERANGTFFVRDKRRK